MDNIHECSTYYPIIWSGIYHTYILDSNHCTSEGYVHNYILYNYIQIRNIYAQIRQPSLLSQVYPLESYDGEDMCLPDRVEYLLKKYRTYCEPLHGFSGPLRTWKPNPRLYDSISVTLSLTYNLPYLSWINYMRVPHTILSYGRIDIACTYWIVIHVYLKDMFTTTY